MDPYYNREVVTYFAGKYFMQRITVVSKSYSGISNNISHVNIFVQVDNKFSFWMNLY